MTLEKKYEVDPDTGCWTWTGRITKGYGEHIYREGGRKRYIGAHRAVYLASGREIPDGLQLDHLCRNTVCVNPEHLEPVTGKENVRRAMEATGTWGRPRAESLEGRVGCGKHGQEDGKWVVDKRGYDVFRCRICSRARYQAWKARQAAS